MDDAAQIRANGWKQGSVLLPEQLPSGVADSLAFTIETDDLLYVLTQDCDLVQKDFDREPYVELLLIRPILSIDGNYAYGKNSRLLDFSIGESSYRASCHDRCRIDRRLLAPLSPSEVHQGDPQVCDLIADWMAKRYIRPAFPDQFNNRLKREEQFIRKFLKKHGHAYSRIYMHCAPRNAELDEDEDYKLTVWLVLHESNSEPVDVLMAQKLVVEFEQILDGCRGINVLECMAVREDEVTLAHLRVLSLWDFDSLTYRELDN